MPLDEQLEAAAHKNVQIALRDLRRAKEMRVLIQETIAFGTEENKRNLRGLISTNRPDLIPLSEMCDGS